VKLVVSCNTDLLIRKRGWFV